MKVLVTGGAGFIGSHIAAHFLSQGAEVVVLDSFRSGSRRNLEELPGARLVEASVTDPGAVLSAARGADYVFHLAAMVSVPESLEKPEECVDINVVGTLNVLRAARSHGCRKVVLSSSAAVYGDDPELPKRESMRPCPRTPYGITKLDGEYYLEMARTEWGVPTVSLRYFNVYGPRQDPRSQYAAAIPTFASRALKGEDVSIYGDGLQTRDFIYVRDVVAANVLAATNSAMWGTFNVAGGKAVTILELAREIVRRVGSPSRILHGPERPGDIRHSVADVGRIRGFGFEPEIALREGLAATLDFFASAVRS
ncbi:MAG: SDR family NAD(P)-dependent oxidoreductase [Candidatus Eremiobacterota bacterium]